MGKGKREKGLWKAIGSKQRVVKGVKGVKGLMQDRRSVSIIERVLGGMTPQKEKPRKASELLVVAVAAKGQMGKWSWTWASTACM